MTPGLYYLSGIDDGPEVGKISLKKIGKGLAKVGKGIVKVATTPLRLAAKAIVEVAIPKAAMSFLYLFINKPDVLEKMPQAIKDKRAKQKKTADFIIKKIGMKEAHLMSILRKGIQKKTGRSPEDNLRDLFPGAGIGLIPVAMNVIKTGLPIVKQLLDQLMKIFGGGASNAEEMQPDESDFEDAGEEQAEAIEGLGTVKKAAGKAKTAVKKVAAKATKKVAAKKKVAKAFPRATASSARTKQLMAKLPSAKTTAGMLKKTAASAKAVANKKLVAQKQKNKAGKIIAAGLAVATTAASLIRTARPTNQPGVLEAEDGSVLINNQDGGTTIKTPAGNEVTLTAEGTVQTSTGTYEVPAAQKEEVKQTIQQANTTMDVKTGGQETKAENVRPPVDNKTGGEGEGDKLPEQPMYDADAADNGSSATELPNVIVTPTSGKNDNTGLLIGAAIVGALLLSGSKGKR